MSIIQKHHFSGGRGIVTQTAGGVAVLETILNEVADDLAALQGIIPAAIASPDAVVLATIASPDASDLATAQTLVNEIKVALNTASFDNVVALANEIKTALNAARTANSALVIKTVRAA